ncbi:ankyrin repeat protein, putative [Trichomonas vaginalis G3]|uniref:Ankyrin repeat protein, putative n=1 Tax=Trichomonas vaginalis (strain ATCC PRA-98 / G3) TaxID=412133 RepID=A2EHS7_TRIV3|nr:Ankyrin repeat family [Trichomonas vaginalis G3]EAY07767.1 ankyrin repeat protein, putative [Trichomonas vaginalis G3]KAI5542958.1 Ankyrin repeat family [Trichomonas vaginalis G3]|eukprot:XP_001319990.1 ankyrin repeat protein [Trichomonas vaginalis G3]
MVVFLLSHGANINAKDDNESTSLHHAAGNNRKEMTELLLSHGSNINEKIKMEKPLFILQHVLIQKK